MDSMKASESFIMLIIRTVKMIIFKLAGERTVVGMGIVMKSKLLIGALLRVDGLKMIVI